MAINKSFTTAGLLLPIFVLVYRLMVEEISNDEIITIDVPGLTIGSD